MSENIKLSHDQLIQVLSQYKNTLRCLDPKLYECICKEILSTVIKYGYTIYNMDYEELNNYMYHEDEYDLGYWKWEYVDNLLKDVEVPEVLINNPDITVHVTWVLFKYNNGIYLECDYDPLIKSAFFSGFYSNIIK